MTAPPICPACGTAIPAAAPGGLCPRCLLGAGFDSGPAASDPQATRSLPAGAGGFEPPSPAALASRFPQLDVLELLGKGGMGAVYKARQRSLDRLVAVKVLPPGVGLDLAFAERFAREARAMARLNHPNIVAVYDFGQADGLYYLVMEYVDGLNLRQALRAGTVTPADALAIVPQVCEALQFAHDNGVVHRDIKPENVLLDRRGRVKIADFGLAKLLGQGPADHDLTGTHQVMGTLKYMAPEQLEATHAVDHRADIYSLGVVFYELLTGELPLGRFPPPSKKVQVDVRLDEVVLRALEKEPEQRYQHASEVKTEVETIARAPAPSPGPRAPEHGGTLVPHPGDTQERQVTAAAGTLDDRVARQVRAAAAGLISVGVLMPLLAVLQDPLRVLPAELGPLVPGWSQIPFGAFVTLGGWNLLRLRGRRVVLAAAIVPMFPLTAACVVGIPVGLWVLGVLARPEVKAAFTAAERRRRLARRQAGPVTQARAVSTGLMIVGGLMAVAAVVVVPLWREFLRDGALPRMGSDVEMIVILHGYWSVLVGLLVAFWGWRLRGLRGRGTGIAAAVLAMLPLSAACVVGLPVGLWAVRVLTRRRVRGAFADAERRRGEELTRQEERHRANPYRLQDSPFYAAGYLLALTFRQRWVRVGLQTLCGLVYLACLVLFFSFSGSGGGMGPERRADFRVGEPGPWLVIQTGPTGFSANVQPLSGSIAAAVMGLLALALARRLEVLDRGRVHALLWHYLVWGVLLLIVLALGLTSLVLTLRPV